MSSRGSFGKSRQVQRKLRSIVKDLKEHPDIQDIYDALQEHTNEHAADDEDEESPLEFLFKPEGTDKYDDKFEPFVKDVENCLKIYAKIKKVKFEDVSLLLFFYHSIMDLFSDSMKESDRKKFTKLISSKIPKVESPVSKSSRSKSSSSSLESSSTRDSRYAKILSVIKKDKRATMFLYPVDVSAAPGYLDVVKKPMDLSTVSERLDQGKYDYAESASVAAKSKIINSFAADMRLIWNNCMTYNAPGSAIYDSSEQLGESFERLFESSFESGFADSASVSSKIRDSRYSQIINVIKKDKRAKVFLYPVDVSAAPGYLDVVKKPMDLSTVSERLDQGKYDYAESASVAAKSKVVNSFAADMRLIWNNCMTYNAPGSAIYDSSEQLGESFERLFESTFDSGFVQAEGKSSKTYQDSFTEVADIKVRDARFAEVMKAMGKNPHAEQFLLPVDLASAPGYLEVVDKPMDLSTMQERLDHGRYDYSASATLGGKSKMVNYFANDMRLIWNNCMTYNAPGYPIYESSKELGRSFERLFESLFKVGFPDTPTGSDSPCEEEDDTKFRDPRYTKILNTIKKNKNAKWFALPVDLASAPGYLDVVKKPMDLSLVADRLGQGKYDYSEAASLQDKSKMVNFFASDMRLIWNNCMAYNEPGYPIYEASEELGEKFESLFEASFKGEFGVFLTTPNSGPLDGVVVDSLKESRPKRSKAVATASEDPVDNAVNESLYRNPRFAKILSVIKKDKRATVFLYPVDVSAAPGYLDVVKKPMDLSTVSERLDQGKYDYAESASVAAKSKIINSFAADMRLIWNNCMTYNAPGSAIYESSEQLGESFDRLFESSFGDEIVKQNGKAKPQESIVEDSGKKKKSHQVKEEGAEKSLSEKPSVAPVSTAKEKAVEKAVEKAKKKKDAAESEKASAPGGYFVPADFSNKRHRKLIAFMSTLKNHPLSYPFVGKEGDPEFFPPRDFKTIEKHLEYYCDKRIEEFMDHIHGVLDYVNVMASKNGLKCTKLFDFELQPVRSDDTARAAPVCIDTPTFYALIVNKFQTDYFPSIYFKAWKDKRKVYLPLSVQVKAQSLHKKITQNELARDALVKVHEDIKHDAVEGTGTGIGDALSARDTVPFVEEGMFQLSKRDFEDMYEQIMSKPDSSTKIDPRMCQHVVQYTSRYAHAGFRHWQAQYSGTFHDNNGRFLDIKFANDMYKVIDYGKICGTQSFANFTNDGLPKVSNYLFPLGYKCLRTLVLCQVPRDDLELSQLKPNSTKHKAIQGPEAYSHVEVEFISEIVSQSVTPSDTSPYALRISVGNGTTVVEAPLTHAEVCKDAWVSCLHASMGTKILKALGAPLRRCRAVLNRLCALPFIMPFLECIPINNQKTSVAYYAATPAPMWLREVHSRLVQGTYEYVYDFAWDVRLVFTNCFDYNLPGSALYKAAENALKFFEILLCQWVHNVHDVHVDDLAKGPWDMWMHLKYFDGHTIIASSVAPGSIDLKTVSSEMDTSPARLRSKEGAADDDPNRCCITNSLGTAKQPLLFCEFCEDSYHVDVPVAQRGENRQKIWVCPRCVVSPDWEDCVKDPEMLLMTSVPSTAIVAKFDSNGSADDSKMEVDGEVVSIAPSRVNSNSTSTSSGGGMSRYRTAERYLPAPELGAGWCMAQTGDKQLFLSPLGYYLSNSLEVYRHILDEVETCNELLEARKVEFAAERDRLVTSNPGSSKKQKVMSKKKRSTKAAGGSVDVVSATVPDTMLTTGKVAVCNGIPDDLVCVWMGFVGEVEYPDRAYLPRERVQLQEAKEAIKQTKMVTSANISSLFSTWGRDPERKTYLSVLNLEEREGGSADGTSKKMLTTAGLTGLDDPAIHLCVEGLDGLDLMLSCLQNLSYSYEYMYAAPVLAELRTHIVRVVERKEAMARAELQLTKILSSEKVAYSVLLKQEADAVIGFGNRSVDAPAEPCEFESLTQSFFSPVTPPEWDISGSELELLLKTWEFLSATKSLIGNHAFGLLDLAKSVTTPVSSTATSGFVPNIPTLLFDELCCNLTAVLLNHIKDSVLFPGLKSLLVGATSGPGDPLVCSRQLSGFASGCASSLGDGLYLGESKLSPSFLQLFHMKTQDASGTLNEFLEGIWQDSLLVNPLNVLTWPVVAHRAISVLAYVEAIKNQDMRVVQNENVNSAVKKGALLSFQIFTQFDDFGSDSDQDRALILDLWLVLLNHPSSGLVWNCPVGKDTEPLCGLVNIESKLVRGVNVNNGDVYTTVAAFVTDVKQVLKTHVDASDVSSEIVEIRDWFDDVAPQFMSFPLASSTPLIIATSSTSEESSFSYLSSLTTAMRYLTRLDPESLGKSQRLDLLDLFLHLGVDCEEYKLMTKELKEQNMSKLNQATGATSASSMNSKKQLEVTPTAVAYPELFPLLIAPPLSISAAMKVKKPPLSPELTKFIDTLEAAEVPTTTPTTAGKSKKAKLTETGLSFSSAAEDSYSVFRCHFTGLEPKYLPKGGDWVYVPDELVAIKGDAGLQEASGEEAGPAPIPEASRPSRHKRLSSEVILAPPLVDTAPRPVCLRAIVVKIATVRDSMNQASGCVHPDRVENTTTPSLVSSLASFYPPSKATSMVGDELNHVSRLLYTFPVGLDRLGREYFYCNAQRDNLLAGLNINKSTSQQYEPGLLVRHKKIMTEWQYIKMEGMTAFMETLDDTHPCEKFLKQRLLVEFAAYKNFVRQGIGLFLSKESEWCQGYQQTEMWLQQFDKDCTKSAADDGQHVRDLVRKLEVAYARTADTRLTIHSAILSTDIDDDNHHEYAYKGLIGLDWSSLSIKEVKRMVDLKRRHKRSKILEMCMEYHPTKGWLRQTENFERVRQLGAATIASRVHSEPHLLDQIRLSHARSRYVTFGAHVRFGLALMKKKEPKKGALLYARTVTPSSVPHMIPSTVLCSHRMIKLKTELLNVVAILPQEKLEFVMAVQSVKNAAVGPTLVAEDPANIETQQVINPPGEDGITQVGENSSANNDALPSDVTTDEATNKRARDEFEGETSELGEDSQPAKKLAAPKTDDSSSAITTNVESDDRRDETAMSNAMEVDVTASSNDTLTIENSVVPVAVSEYVVLVQKCTKASDLFLLVVMLEQASGLDFGQPVMLSTSRIEQVSDTVGVDGVIEKASHLLLSHVARRLYTLDRSLRYEEMERINSTSNGLNAEDDVIATSAVNYRPRIDYLPKCIHTTLCFRPMCHYHKCMAYNPETEHVANPSAPGFTIRSIFPTQESIPPRYGMDMLASNIMLSINCSGQLQPGWNRHVTGSNEFYKSGTKDVENPDNWRTLQNNEFVKQDHQAHHGYVDYSTSFGMGDDAADERVPEFQEQILDVSVVQPFVPSMSEIVQSEWV